MSEFKTYTLDQLCIVGSSKRVHLSDYVQQGIPFYRSKEVIELSSGKNISEQLFISSEKYSKIKSKFPVPQENDVLITAVGTIGEILVVKDPNFYFKDGNLIWLRNINFEIIDIDYLYYFLKSDLFQKTIKYNNIGAVQKALTIDFLKTVKITLPSLDNQIKLISVLKLIDKKLKINNQINQELEAMAKTLYDYWFVQFDFPDKNGKPYKSSGGKMVYHPELKREIPEGWGVEKLGELIELERGVTYAKSDIVEKTTKDAIGVLRATNITGNVMDLNDLVYLTKDKINNKQIIKQNETLIVMSSGSKEHLGKNAINYYEEVIGFGAFCSKIVPQKYSAFINTFLQSSEFKGYLLKQSMGTNINNLTNSDILDCRIILPKEEILDKFENMVEKNIKLISNNYIQNQELTHLRDWLLPMLMNGQVKVE